MRVGLSNDEWFYIEQNDIKLVLINDKFHIVGGQILYGISESGERYRLNPDVSTCYLEKFSIESTVVDSVYNAEEDVYDPVYADVPTWTLTNLTLDSEHFSIPSSMNANDTYNFDNFGLSHLFVIFIAVFVAFRVFKH